MIRYLKRHQIDDNKYNTCIKSAKNARIYAYSWYLDCVADNWDVLVLNDYEAVMPLPWRQKYFIKYVYPPAWTQQLGVFSEKKISKKLISEFIKAIPKKFKKITIQFNSENDLSLFKIAERVNYILPLNKSYDEIYKGFSINRKRDFKKAISSTLKVNKKVSYGDFLAFYLNTEKEYALSLHQISALKKLLKMNIENICIWGVRVNQTLVAGLVWLIEGDRITYLLPIATKEAKKKGLPTRLVAELIQQFSKSNLTLDFEGSMISGVASFYNSFGAEDEVYTVCQKLLFSSVKSQ